MVAVSGMKLYEMTVGLLNTVKYIYGLMIDIHRSISYGCSFRHDIIWNHGNYYYAGRDGKYYIVLISRVQLPILSIT